jgi:uncharacterized protein
MIGTLTKDQIEHVLRSGLIGRIGCHDDRKVYVVPVTYVFDGKHIYAHSREGQKVRMMRQNPKVCFEVDSLETITNWRCVIVHGKFHEMKTVTEQAKASKILNDRLAPYLLSETMRPQGFDQAPEQIRKDRKPVMYRIEITEMTGRYEKNINPGNLLK